MQRHLAIVLAIVAFGSTAVAQPAPPPAEPAPVEPPPTPPTTPSPDPAVPTPAAPAKPADDGPRKIAVGKDALGAFIQPSLVMQGWFVLNTFTRPENGAVESTSLTTSTFRLRRLELTLRGDIIPKFVTYRFMFDLARPRDTINTVNVATGMGTTTVRTPCTGTACTISMLQDFYITFVTPFVDISVGQFKNPVSWDSFGPSSKLLFPDRAFATNLVGGIRDVGLRFDKTFEKFMFSASLFNGSGQNNLDVNNQKDAGLRLEVYPIKGLTIAGVTFNSIGYRGRAGTKDRFEGDLRYEAGPFLFQGEYIHIQDKPSDVADQVKARAAYAAIGYTLKNIGSGALKGNLQPALRFGYFDPNIDINVNPAAMPSQANFGVNDERMDFEVGLNYYLRAHEMKFQIAYDRQVFDDSDTLPARNEIIVATQISY